MKQTPAGEYLRHVGVTPLVRPTRNQAEVTFLPPYGDPEVNVIGEVGTYLAIGALSVAVAERLTRRSRSSDADGEGLSRDRRPTAPPLSD